MRTTLRFILTGSASLLLANSVLAGGPSYDCSTVASTSIEALVCQSDELSALDRQLAEVYAAARKKAVNAHPPTLKAEQRGWIKGRNDCWKSGDSRACIVSSYKERIVELQIQYGQLVVPSPVYYTCNATDLTAVFYNQTDPQAVVLTVIPILADPGQMTAFRVHSASGARYEGGNVEFWEHHGEAQLSWYDKVMSCSKQDNQGGSD